MSICDPNAKQQKRGVLVCKPLLGDGELPQFVPHHVLCHMHWDVVFSIMNHEPDSIFHHILSISHVGHQKKRVVDAPHKIRKDCA